jgi:hypothetical protein
VHNHLAKAQIENLGQIMERLIDGDEGLLALDGIGPKALAEIKTQVEEMAPTRPEEPEAEVPVEAEPEAEPALALEEVAVAEAEVIEEPVAAVPEPVELKAEVPIEIPVAAEAETEAEEVPVAPLDPEEAARRAERERALAQIPADAYDIPLEVLALSDWVQDHLKQAQIENLGHIMERLIDGDEGLLAVEGISPKALAEIKDRVELMVSVPVAEPEEEEEVAPPRPRYEYVADDELERKTQPKRRKRERQRRLVYDEDVGKVVSHRERKDPDEWELIDG